MNNICEFQPSWNFAKSLGALLSPPPFGTPPREAPLKFTSKSWFSIIFGVKWTTYLCDFQASWKFARPPSWDPCPPTFIALWTRPPQELTCKTWVSVGFEGKWTTYMIFSHPEILLGPPRWDPPFGAPPRGAPQKLTCKTWFSISFEVKWTTYVIFSLPENLLGPPSWDSCPPFIGLWTRPPQELTCKTWVSVGFEGKWTTYMIFSHP